MSSPPLEKRAGDQEKEIPVNRIYGLIIVTIVAVAVMALPGTALAREYVFTPSSPTLWDLDHHKHYTWGIEFDLADDETIVSAEVNIAQIRNWDRNANDLYLHLLDNEQELNGVTVGTDNQGGGDYFADTYADEAAFLDHWQNLPFTPAVDIEHALTLAEVNTLTSYLADGFFGLGFDPDCHFWNQGISFTINTTTTPPNNQAPLPAAVWAALPLLAGLPIARRLRQRG
jgi:hypothetical protein